MSETAAIETPTQLGLFGASCTSDISGLPRIDEGRIAEEALARCIRTIRGEMAGEMADDGRVRYLMEQAQVAADACAACTDVRSQARAGSLYARLAELAGAIVDREDRRKALSQPANNVFMGPTQINIEVSPARREDYARWIESAKPEEVTPDAASDNDRAEHGG